MSSTDKATRTPLTDFQRECLEVLMKAPNNHGSLQYISRALGKKGTYRLAIASALRNLLDVEESDGIKYRKDSGTYVCRLAPRDRWGHEIWCVTREGARLLGYERVEGVWRLPP